MGAEQSQLGALGLSHQQMGHQLGYQRSYPYLPQPEIGVPPLQDTYMGAGQPQQRGTGLSHQQMGRQVNYCLPSVSNLGPDLTTDRRDPQLLSSSRNIPLTHQ